MRSRSVSVSIAFTAILIASLTLAACGVREGNDDRVEPMVLRTYQVPAEHRAEIAQMLQSALGYNDTQIGRVSEGPGGTLLVAAPARIQSGIAELVNADIEDDSPVPSSIRLTYWVLIGRPLESSNEPFTVVGRRLPRIEGVLSQIAAAQEPTEFMLLDELQVSSLSQYDGSAKGASVEVNQEATRRGDQIVAQISIAGGAPSHNFHGQIALREGQVLVLGRSSTRYAGFTNSQPNGMGTVYYIVAAEPS